MMLGKRGRPSFRRTSSSAGITFDVGVTEAVIGGEINGCDQTMMARCYRKNGSVDFLWSCGLCNRRLAPGRDIYMYRGDTAFCSLECREQQIKQDERKERRAAATAAAATNHPPELEAAAPKTKTVVAA